MSTITVTNIKATGETASRAVSGVAAAWVSFDQTVPSVNDSQNVSSVTDSSTGDFTINFSSNLSSADYCWSSGLGGVGVNDSSTWCIRCPSSGTAPTASAIRLQQGYVNASTNYTKTDLAYDCVSFHGDLA